MTPEAMAALHGACFTLPRPWVAAEFAAMLADPLILVLAEPGGLLVGRVVAEEAEVLTLAVAPGARRGGIGAHLVARFLDEAAARGAEAAFLEVATSNRAAIGLYQQAGFARTGIRRGYYDGTDALILARPLPPAPPEI